MSWNYRSVADLNETIINWMGDLLDFDLIVGIPRSGMLAASLLALHLNLPLASLDGFRYGNIMDYGPTKPDRRRKVKRALVIDDSVYSGTEMDRARWLLSDPICDVAYAAAYVAPNATYKVDFYAEVVPTPRFYEWNLMHYEDVLARSCMDIDGVLCQDPTRFENDGDGPLYQRFLNEARPLYLPSAPVRRLVTSRLERYREQTEAWLAANGVEYGDLVMMDYPDAESRRRDNMYAEYKRDVYLGSGADLFIESELDTAHAIRSLTGRQVFCMETKELL